MNEQHPAIPLLEELVRAGAIHGWKHFASGFTNTFHLYRDQYEFPVSFTFMETEFWSASSAKMRLQAAVHQLDLAVRTCADQPAAVCALTPRKVPDLLDMPLPKGYRWPVTTIMGMFKRNPVPSLQIGMMSLYSAAREAYRRTGSMRRVKRELVALNIALAFDQRQPYDALYATRYTSADRVLQRINGLCQWRHDFLYGRLAGSDTCSGESVGDGPLCLPLPRGGRDGFPWARMWVSI